MAWPLIAAAAASVIGGAIQGNAASKAQSGANAANAALAKQQSQDAYNNWLTSRGINPGTRGVADYAGYLAAHPEYQAEYNRVKAAGDRRTFDQWFEDHLNLNPTERAAIASFGGSGAINTTLPLWATIGGQPAEQNLLNRILQTGMSSQELATSAEQQFLKDAPAGDVQWWRDRAADYGVSTIGEAVALWERDHPEDPPNKPWEAAILGAHKQAASGRQESAKAVPAEYQDLQNAALASAGRIFDGGYLNDELNALAPALAARRAAADLGFGRNAEMRSRVGDIYDAERLGAGSIYDASTGAAKKFYDAQLLSADAYGTASKEAVNRVLAEQAAKRRVQGFSGGSSFDDLTRARTMAGAFTQGALARTGAGETYGAF